MKESHQREWIAVPSEGEDEIVARADSRDELLDELGRKECPTCGSHSMDPDGYEIIAVQKTHKSLFI